MYRKLSIVSFHLFSRRLPAFAAVSVRCPAPWQVGRYCSVLACLFFRLHAPTKRLPSMHPSGQLLL